MIKSHCMLLGRQPTPESLKEEQWHCGPESSVVSRATWPTASRCHRNWKWTPLETFWESLAMGFSQKGDLNSMDQSSVQMSDQLAERGVGLWFFLRPKNYEFWERFLNLNFPAQMRGCIKCLMFRKKYSNTSTICVNTKIGRVVAIGKFLEFG